MTKYVTNLGGQSFPQSQFSNCLNGALSAVKITYKNRFPLFLLLMSAHILGELLVSNTLAEHLPVTDDAAQGIFALMTEFTLPSSDTPILPLFTARGLPGMLAFLFSDPAAEVLKLAWEPQSSSEPEDSSKKGTLLICVAFWKTDLYG